MKKNGKRKLLTGLLLFLMLVFATVPVFAASKAKTGWVKRSGNMYYYNEEGKKETGIIKIGKRYYYFDRKGVQHVGWQKLKNQYYYFMSAYGTKGYRVTSKKIDGIALDKKGVARVTSANRRKLDLMVKVRKTVEKITNANMSQSQMLRKCFDYTKTYKYKVWRRFSAVKDWDMLYAEDMLYRGGGNCFAYAAAFAYMADAIGCKDVCVVSSGGHGWAEIRGRVYDPDWALVSKVDDYYDMSYNLSGVQGRPNYKPNRAFVVKL